MRKLIVVALVAAAATFPSSAADEPASSRIYLLATSSGAPPIWTTDQTDPYAQAPDVGWGCGLNADGLSTVPCTGMQNGATLYIYPFEPGALLSAPVTWSAGSEPRFHFELGVALTSGRYTVHTYVTRSPGAWESAPATEVAPGVFEGTLPSAASLAPTPATTIAVGVRVYPGSDGSPGHFRGYTVKTAGASYIDFDQPIAAKAFPRLAAENTYAPQPSGFASVDHSFTFNDSNWEVIPFEGNTSTALTVPFSLDAEAAAVYAYVDDWADPAIHRGVRRQNPEPRNLSSPYVEILDGDVLEARGQRAAATPALPAGDYTVSVERGGGNTLPLDIDYEGYIVIAHGERTLRSMQFRFPQGVIVNVTSPAVNNFATGLESFLVPREATTADFDFSYDSVNPAEPQWYLVWSMYGYGSGTTRGRSRAVVDSFAAGALTANPARGKASVTSQNILFDVTITFAYTPLA